MTRTARQLDEIHTLMAKLTTPVLTGLAAAVTTADIDWTGHGFPAGGSSDGGRSADRSSITERAALGPDQIGPRIAAIHDHIDQALHALRALHADIAWLAPTTIDPTAPAKTATCLGCERIVAGIPDVRNRAGIVVRLGDPLKAGRCRQCHTAWLAAQRAHPTNGAMRDALTGRLGHCGGRGGT